MIFHSTTSEQLIQKPFILISLFIILVTATVYGQVQGFDFVNYDDGDYVSDNPHVQEGITFDSIIWAFTTVHASNWHPLTWLSHMLDCQMFGLWAGGHHLISLFFHIINTLLLFFTFRKMTGDFWQSGFIAIIFALHPLHIQSVAWVSERKDVLSTFFWMLTLIAYVRYVHHSGRSTYAWVVFIFILGLMSKPMVVTLPFVMLLLDYWPLNRIHLNSPGNNSNLKLKLISLILEKIPLFLLSAASAGITFYVQQQAGSVKSSMIPLTDRLPNILISYMNYIVKTVYPSKLAAFYPYPAVFPWWKVSIAIMTLAVLSGLSIRLIYRAPYIIVGWLWFIGTLVPVIGLVQVGIQSMADRYMYLPMIGLLIPVAWGIPELIPNSRYKSFWLGIPAIIVVVTLSIVTWDQTRYWKDSISLFSQAIAATENNYLAHYNLGNALVIENKIDKAIVHFQKAVAVNHNDPQIYRKAQYNLGTLLFEKGQLDLSISHLEKAVALEPDDEQAQFNLSNALFQKKRYDLALIHAQKTITLNPGHEKANQLAGIILYDQEHFDKALSYFNAALTINPKLTAAHYYKGIIFLRQKRIDKAMASFKKALVYDPDNKETRQLLQRIEAKITTEEQRLLQELEINPNNDGLHFQLGKIYKAQNLSDKAIEQYKLVIRQHPESVDALYDLVSLYADQGEYKTAIAYIKQAMFYQPNNPAHDYNMACLFARQNQTSAAIEWLKKAKDKGYGKWDQIWTDEDLKPIRGTLEFKRLIENR